eukprot:gb/GECG01000281.1/.p1 GENE.gb/GECG01000281.1/~~gb/GECG01000281.1/.p1  ORF type:complete len:827 (+),score=83.35 gb/GECG01000281.1/:1-2481(+)
MSRPQAVRLSEDDSRGIKRACKKRDLERIEAILPRNASLTNVEVQVLRDTVTTPLHLAIHVGNVNLVRRMLEAYSVDVNAPEPQTGKWTPLHCAASSTDHAAEELVRVLVHEYNADVNALDESGFLPRDRCRNENALHVLDAEEAEEVEIEERPPDTGAQGYPLEEQDSTSTTISDQGSNEVICCICWERYKVEPGDRRPMIVCGHGHSFCRRCARAISSTCPMCRCDVLRQPIENRALIDALRAYGRMRQKIPMIDPYEFKLEETPFMSGAQAAIHRGEWYGQPVAVKVVNAPLDSSTIKELKDEAALIIGLHHPNIARIYGLTQLSRNSLGMVMEYFEHGNLRRLFSEVTDLSIKEKMGICWDVVGALRYLHSKRIVHRDLKPENVLIIPNMDQGQRFYKAVVADFGVSKILQTLNVASRMVGIPKYTAPELLQPQKPFSTAADIFSLGVLMYELFSGQDIFPEHSLMQVMHAVISGKRPSVPTAIPHSISDFITRAWKTDEAERPSLDEMKKTMEIFLYDQHQAYSEDFVSSPVHEETTIEEQALVVSESMFPVPSAEVAWEVDEPEMAKTLREKMVTNLEQSSSFRHLFHRPLLRATKCVPRHKFGRSDEALSQLASSADGSISGEHLHPDGRLTEQGRLSLQVAYSYSIPMPATQWTNESAVQVLLAQLSLVHLVAGSNAVLLGAKGGYTQALVAQLLGLHGTVTTISGSEEALKCCKERCYSYVPTPLFHNMRWQRVSTIDNWDAIVAVLKKQENRVDAFIVCGAIDSLPAKVVQCLRPGGSALAPINSDRSGKQVLQVKSNPLPTRDITDFGVQFDKPV